MRTEDIDIKDLSAECILNRSVDYDWSEGYTETWDYQEAICCECGTYNLLHDGECSECGEEIDDGYAEGPMMNYYYPIPRRYCGDEDNLAMSIADLPLCVVTIGDNECGLALTGGGMDLSWFICEAHMRIGLLPPLQFCRLPQYIEGWTPRKQKIIDACKRSIDIAMSWLEQDKREIEQVDEYYRARQSDEI